MASVVAVPPPKPTEAPAIAAPAVVFTLPVIDPLPETSVMAGAAVVVAATTVTVVEPDWNPVREALIVVDPAGRSFSA